MSLKTIGWCRTDCLYWRSHRRHIFREAMSRLSQIADLS